MLGFGNASPICTLALTDLFMPNKFASITTAIFKAFHSYAANKDTTKILYPPQREPGQGRPASTGL